MMSCEYLRPSRRDKGKVSFALFSDICSEASDCRLPRACFDTKLSMAFMLCYQDERRKSFCARDG